MKKIIYTTTLILLLLLNPTLFAWNALGHRIIAQIAYDNMTAKARSVFNHYNHAMDKVYKPLSWINAATWLDTLKYQNINWYEKMHYIDIPFSDDGSALPPIQEINALWAIDNATHLLQNKYAKHFDKGIALRVLLHVVGDIHQPLHAATRISAEYPKGDRGGNLVTLDHNPVANNLHAYWDKGGGLLVNRPTLNEAQVAEKALNIERHWPCNLAAVEINPANWANESHQLAVKYAYHALSKNNRPDKKYQHIVEKISEQQLAVAGCRLAALLNAI